MKQKIEKDRGIIVVIAEKTGSRKTLDIKFKIVNTTLIKS